MMKNINLIIILFFLSISVLSAQNLETTNVNVVEGFQAEIPESSRLNENAVFADTIKKNRVQDYEIINSDINMIFKTNPLKAAVVKEDKIPKLFSTSISLGTGYRNTSKVLFSFSSKRSKILSYSLYLDHFNNNIKIDGKEAGKSVNNLLLNVKKIHNDKTHTISLDYQRIGLFTFGIGTSDKDSYSDLGFTNNPYYNRFSYTRLSYSLSSIFRNELRHKTIFFVSDFNEMSENHLHLSSNLYKVLNDVPISLDFDVNSYLNYNNADFSFERIATNTISFEPYMSISRYGIDFDLGLEMCYLSDESSFHLFPEVKASLDLVEGVLLIYGGLRHTDKRNTLKSLSDINPYIHSYGTNQSILGQNGTNNIFFQRLSNTEYNEVYFSIRNMLSDNAVLSANINYARVNNFLHFILIEDYYYKRFIADYIDIGQLHTNVHYLNNINRIISLELNADYYQWNKQVYHTPNLMLDLRIPINFREKIKLTKSFSFVGERLSNDTQIDLSPLFQINFSLDYTYSKQLSAYIHLNNITNSKKELLSSYRSLGFNGVFGVNYSF